MNRTLFFLSWRSHVLFHKETLMLCLNEFLCCAPTDAPPSAHYPHHRVRCKPEWLRLMSSRKNYFSVVSLRWQTPPPPTPVTPMNTVSGLSFEPRAPRSDMQQRNWSENQGSEPSNRLVKEPATTASSMGYKQHRVDLKHSTEEGAAVVSVSDIWQRYNLLVQSGVAAARFLWIFVTRWMSVFIKHFLLLFLAYIPRQKAKRWKASPSSFSSSSNWTSVSAVSAAAPTDTSRWRARWEHHSNTNRDGTDCTSGMKSNTCFLHLFSFLHFGCCCCRMCHNAADRLSHCHTTPQSLALWLAWS